MLITKIKNWFLPYICVFCGDFTHAERDLCIGCEQELPWLTHACNRCALPLPTATPLGQQCGDCLQQSPPFQKTIALFQYQTPIDHLITGLKFQQKLIYAKLLSELLIQQIQKSYDAENLPELIIPMPLHHKRLQERGFNQAVEIARSVAKKLKIKMDLKSCRRVRATAAQTTLPAAQRKDNIKNAFYIGSKLSAKHIAILDDVVTTGYTVTELARELHKSGVERIDVWCCARTNMLGD